LSKIIRRPEPFAAEDLAAWRDRLFIPGIDIIGREGEEKGLPAALETLYRRQLDYWPGLGEAVAAFDRMQVRPIRLERRRLLLQHNPARVKNVTAPLSPAKLAARPCPLCPQNMPAEQKAVPFDDGWLVVCNPLPIFRNHFVLVYHLHVPQAAAGILDVMLRFTRITGYVSLYNGPASGASIPDHLHLQASPPGSLPLERQLPRVKNSFSGLVADSRLPRRIFLFGRDDFHARELFDRTLAALGRIRGENRDGEPALNLAVVRRGRKGEKPPVVVIHPRSKHRPDCFYFLDERRCVVSPGAADMAGLVIMPRKEDFESLDGRRARAIFREVMLDEERFVRAVKLASPA